MSEQKWFERYWAQITFVAGITLVIGGAAVSWWHQGQHSEDKGPSEAEVEVVKNDVSHIKESLDDMKETQRDIGLQIIDLLRDR